MLHRGHGRVVRKLVGLTFDGPSVPAPATPVTAHDGRDIGRVTSSVMSPTLGVPIAMAYVHRDFVDPGTAVTVADVKAQVTPLPFVGQ